MSSPIVHGELGVKLPQTPCGLALTDEIQHTPDPFLVTCLECVRLLQIMGTLPDPDRPHTRGRPPEFKRRTHEKN